MIGVGIVLFNPDIQTLQKNIDSIYGKEVQLLLIDNCSVNICEIKALINSYKAIELICNCENWGVSKAYNQIFEYFDEKNYEWVLTLDQDSVVPSNLIKHYLKYINTNDIGILCPVIDYGVICDMKIGRNQLVERCISSASMIRVECWKIVKGFDEKFFIDFVDFDFCYSVRENGYKIMQISTVVLKHQLGNMKIRFIGKKAIRIMNHSGDRKYFYIRNAIICHKKHKKLFAASEMLRDILLLYIKVLLFEKDKVHKLLFMNRGLIDGIRGD